MKCTNQMCKSEMKNVAHLMMGPHWECRDCNRKLGKYGEEFKIAPNDNELGLGETLNGFYYRDKPNM